jgi:PIN domain nuclease of toxin-antitoxin system
MLAWILEEPGAALVGDVQANAHASTVSIAEVANKLVEREMDDAAVREIVSGLCVTVAAFNADDALLVGLWRRATRHEGLSLGDRACLAIGKRLGLPVYTADRAWADLDLGVEVVLIR